MNFPLDATEKQAQTFKLLVTLKQLFVYLHFEIQTLKWILIITIEGHPHYYMQFYLINFLGSFTLI